MRTLRPLFLVLTILFCLRSAEAQAVRFDSFSSTTNAQCAPGAQCPLLVIPGTQVNFCSGNAVGVVSTAGTIVTWVSGPTFTGIAGSIQIAGKSYQVQIVVSSTTLVLVGAGAGTQTNVPYSSLSGCLGNPATTYTDATAGTSCGTTAQLTPQLGGACVATADNQGNYGAWILPGSYYYYLRTPTTAGGIVSGPYPISIGASAGCPLGATCDASYATLALGCTAAGNGTLYITQAWSGLTAANTAACLNTRLNFLGNGKLQPASGQAVTLAYNYCGRTQQCYDPSLGGTVAFSSSASKPTPQQWGGIPDSSTDSTAALQACINSAWATGTICDLPGSTGTYNTTGLTLPTVVLNNWQLLGIEGEGSVHDMQSGKYGSVIHCTGSSDCIVGNLSVYSDASYIFRDFSLIGPDSSSSGAISGHGLNINATAAAPKVKMSNVSVQGFYGSGKYAMRMVGPENSSFYDVDTSGNNACAYFGGGFNGNTITNWTCQASSSADAILVNGATEVSWSGGVIQSNVNNGIRFNGAIAWTMTSPHFENNNTSATSGQGAIIIDSSGSQYNEYIKILGGGLYASTDNIIAKDDGTGANVYSKIDGLYDAPVANPRVTLGSRTSGFRVIDDVSDCTSVSDTGSGNIFSIGVNQFSCVNGAPAQIYGSPVGFGGNAAPVTPVDIHMATDTQGIRIGDDNSAQSYVYIKPRYDGGGSTGYLGGVFNGGAATDILEWSVTPEWIGMFGTVQLPSFLFAALPSSGIQASNGNMLYCSDCTVANPCAGSGSGAVAKRIAGAWVCN